MILTKVGADRGFGRRPRCQEIAFGTEGAPRNRACLDYLRQYIRLRVVDRAVKCKLETIDKVSSLSSRTEFAAQFSTMIKEIFKLVDFSRHNLTMSQY
jgi:hypothetical protein